MFIKDTFYYVVTDLMLRTMSSQVLGVLMSPGYNFLRLDFVV